MSRKQLGVENSNWRGGKPKCIVCGKQQTVHQSPRCRACANKDKALIEVRRKMFSGTRNPLWKGGITPLTRSIRDLSENYKWRDDVLAKSDYRCADCGNTGYLEAHHIIPFSKLFKDFLNIYNQFSVIDDKETLIRLAVNHKSFFDVSNGKALCVTCHEKYRKEAFGDTQKTDESFFSEGETTSTEASKQSNDSPSLGTL
jgi:5-methylcytosine-specific restriction endonuclease McrA